MKQKFPLVSAVIPAYNEEKFIKHALESVMSQNYAGKVEIIVVDNNSTDNTATIAKKFGAVLIHESRKGVQYARQTGFEAAHGRFIASTDADNILPNHWLKQLVDELLKNPETSAVGGWFRFKKGFFVSRIMMNNLSSPALLAYQFLTGKKVLIGQNFIVRKDLFLKTRGFMDLTPMNEDLQIAQRLAKVGTVTLKTQNNWKILTSPRRWNNSFIRATLPYVVNAISYALTDKIVIKNFKDIRSEKTKISTAFKGAGYIVILLAFIVGFLSLPPSPAHAKIAPITKITRDRITAGGRNVRHEINRTFTHSRRQVYAEYSEQKSRFMR